MKKASLTMTFFAILGIIFVIIIAIIAYKSVTSGKDAVNELNCRKLCQHNGGTFVKVETTFTSGICYCQIGDKIDTYMV